LERESAKVRVREVRTAFTNVGRKCTGDFG